MVTSTLSPLQHDEFCYGGFEVDPAAAKVKTMKLKMLAEPTRKTETSINSVRIPVETVVDNGINRLAFSVASEQIVVTWNGEAGLADLTTNWFP